MKRFIAGLFTAALLAASPVWAHGGGHGDNDERHGGKHLKHVKKQKHKHKHHRRDDRDVAVIQEPRIVERQVTYVQPQPVYVQEPPVNIA